MLIKDSNTFFIALGFGHDMNDFNEHTKKSHEQSKHVKKFKTY